VNAARRSPDATIPWPVGHRVNSVTVSRKHQPTGFGGRLTDRVAEVRVKAIRA
jgi:hypothetical protein